MNQETKNIVKKTVKIAGVTCIALGGAALIASGAALKAVAEGARYLKTAIGEIVRDEPEVEGPAEEVQVGPEEAPVAEASAKEVHPAEEASQEA